MATDEPPELVPAAVAFVHQHIACIETGAVSAVNEHFLARSSEAKRFVPKYIEALLWLRPLENVSVDVRFPSREKWNAALADHLFSVHLSVRFTCRLGEKRFRLVVTRFRLQDRWLFTSIPIDFVMNTLDAKRASEAAEE